MFLYTLLRKRERNYDGNIYTIGVGSFNSSKGREGWEGMMGLNRSMDFFWENSSFMKFVIEKFRGNNFVLYRIVYM